MKKEIDLSLPGVKELGSEELKQIEGGNPVLIAVAIIAVGAMGLAYEVEKDRRNVG